MLNSRNFRPYPHPSSQTKSPKNCHHRRLGRCHKQALCLRPAAGPSPRTILTQSTAPRVEDVGLGVVPSVLARVAPSRWAGRCSRPEDFSTDLCQCIDQRHRPEIGLRRRWQSSSPRRLRGLLRGRPSSKGRFAVDRRGLWGAPACNCAIAERQRARRQVGWCVRDFMLPLSPLSGLSLHLLDLRRLPVPREGLVSAIGSEYIGCALGAGSHCFLVRAGDGAA